MVDLLEKHAAPHREQNVFSQKKRHTVYQHAFSNIKKAHVRLFTRHAPSFEGVRVKRFSDHKEGMEMSRLGAFVVELMH